MKLRRLAGALALVAQAASVVACASAAGEDERIAVAKPDRATFPVVNELLVNRCGSLDCHGSLYRNLKLYGENGLRADPRATPGGLPTSADEVELSYRAVTGLEPEVTSRVVVEGGREPERLTLVRKARGTEKHVGLGLFVLGGVEDVCLTSWLAGRLDAAACTTAVAQSRLPPAR